MMDVHSSSSCCCCCSSNNNYSVRWQHYWDYSSSSSQAGRHLHSARGCRVGAAARLLNKPRHQQQPWLHDC